MDELNDYVFGRRELYVQTEEPVHRSVRQAEEGRRTAGETYKKKEEEEYMREQTEEKVNNLLWQIDKHLKEINNDANFNYRDYSDGDLYYLMDSLEQTEKLLDIILKLK
jgi:uncharacterized FlaG/YvyC family protein